MRGDFEILAYNVIQWAGGELPWEKNKLLGTPVKVQQAKDELMAALDSRLKLCFSGQSCPGEWERKLLFFVFFSHFLKCLFKNFVHFILKKKTEPISAYLKYVTKLKYDEKPDYEKCRKYFVDGLKSLGKSNIGELEFKTSSTTSAKKTTVAASPVKEQRPKVRQTTKVTTKVVDNVENISPKPKTARKRDTTNDHDSSEDSASPMKKARTKPPSTKVSTQRSNRVSTKTSTLDSSSFVVQNHVKEEKAKKGKTYNVNIDLDISFDANVVVSVKRKNKKPPKVVPESPNQSIQSTDEIPPSDKSFVVQTTKVYKRAQRISPRSKWTSSFHIFDIHAKSEHSQIQTYQQFTPTTTASKFVPTICPVVKVKHFYAFNSKLSQLKCMC